MRMGRGKLSMKLIGNEKSRKTTFLKREKSLMRKAYELSTLCDVRTCVFVYGPTQNDQSPITVRTWPTCRDEVNDMIASYKANCLHKRTRKAFGLLDFFSERRKKIEGDMSKLRKDVAEARFPKWDERLEYLLEDQLRLLLVDLDTKLDATKRRIDFITENIFEEGTSAGSSSLQTVNGNMKPKQLIPFEEQNYYNNVFGSSGVIETQAMIPFQYHQYHQIQTMASNLQMENSFVPMFQMDHENLSQYHQLLSSNGYSSAQPQFNQFGNCFQNPNFYSNPQNEMIMESQQNYSMCHYGAPLATQSIRSLPYMQLTDDQVMVKSQIGLPNANSNQGSFDHQFDYFNYEYLMKTNNSNLSTN